MLLKISTTICHSNASLSPSNHIDLTTLPLPSDRPAPTLLKSGTEIISLSCPVIDHTTASDNVCKKIIPECKEVNPRPLLSTTSDIHGGRRVHLSSQPITVSAIHARMSLSAEAYLLKHQQFVTFLESNEENNRHTLNGKHTLKPKYTDQYLLIAVSDECIPHSIEEDLPRNCKKETRLFTMINSWICIPRTQAALAYKIGGLHSRIHGCLTMGSEEEILFHKIFDYIPISHLSLDEGPVELEEINVSLKTGDGTSDIDHLSAELR